MAVTNCFTCRDNNNNNQKLEGIHKLSHVKGGEGDRRSVTLCDKGGRDLNFVTSH